ncbi:MAG: hypothetical protein NC831_03165 [Candidatus Omnitrophica bacterium]|nr:hypothetical protein [Candidatus Omnitrophota bacterium]MCM8828747.1 hypothetical protein [Candidatus Omnitrophota bacterium]
MKEDIFPSDIVQKGKKYSVEPPVNVVVKDTTLLPCARYFIEETKKRSLRHIKMAELTSNTNTAIFSLMQSSDEKFCVRVEKVSGKIIFEFSASSLSSCYYGIQAFFRHSEVNKNSFVTDLKFHSGKTKNTRRNLIISLSWMENLIEFPFYNLEKWRAFIDLVSELRFNRIDFMQWGCTIPEAPADDRKTEDEWELWQNGSKKSGDWPIPEAYRGLKYQQGVWKSHCLFEPWLFPVSGKSIKKSALFSVCYPPERQIPLCRWDIKKQKLISKLWYPPFIKDKSLFRKLTDLIHDRGMRVGLFTTARVPCAANEKNFEQYWKEVIGFFSKQGVDDFVFETEEGPASFQHHRQCQICQRKYGDIFTGYTRKIARQTNILTKIIKSRSENSNIGWILHVPLHAGYGNPPERSQWLANPKNYIENLKIFKSSAPDDFTLDYVPFPGEKNIRHDFLPQIYFDIFGSKRICATGYTHAWGPARTFLGLEVYYIDIARSLWEYDPSKTVWRREEITKKSIEELSLRLYGSRKAIFELARYSINNRSLLFGEKSVVCPLVWDRSRFCISQQVLKKMLINAFSGKQEGYLPYQRNLYESALKKTMDAEKKLEKVKPSKSFLACDWDFGEGFLERFSLVKASRWILEFLLVYDSILSIMADRKKLSEKSFKKLIETGIKINNAAAMGHKSSWWPSSSRLGGIYDYYAFARFLFQNKNSILERFKK